MLWGATKPSLGTIALILVGSVILAAVLTVWWPQAVLFSQKVGIRLKNTLFFILFHPGRVFGAAALQVVYWLILFFLLPWSAFVVPILGDWYVLFLSVFFIYRPLNKDFKVEDQIREAFPDNLVAAWVIIAVITILTKPSVVFLAVEALVLILASLWVAVYTPWNKRRKAYRAFLELYGEDAERTTVFYADRLIVNPEGREIMVMYSDIAKTLTSDHLLIFITAANKGILVKRDGFLKGSENDILKLFDK